MSAVELVVVERLGLRLGFPAVRVAAIDDLPRELRAASLQERLGQPPIGDGERCIGLSIRTDAGEALVPVAGHVAISVIAAEDLAPLPELLAGSGGVSAVVFADAAPVLVLDVDAVIARAGTGARLASDATEAAR